MENFYSTIRVFYRIIFKGFLGCILIGLGLCFPKITFAQETGGGLTGFVKDTQGLPLPGSTIEALHLPTGTKYATSTSAEGTYSLLGLRIGGPYRITVHQIGMTSTIQENIQVNLGNAQVLNFTLSANSKNLNEVIVKSSKSSVKANAYGAGTNISRDQIRNAPSISRSLQDLTRITPQASKDNSFLGSSYRYNNITIDGAVNNDAIGFSPSLGGQTGTSGQPGSSTRSNPFSQEVIQDVQVYLAPYDVKIGNFTGGSINAVTRSGTNAISGSIYAFGRNATLTGPDNAGDHSRLPNSFYDFQTGFRLGFPIVKNKVFLFTNIEIDRRQDPVLLSAGSSEENQVLTLSDAQSLTTYVKNKYGFDIGSYAEPKVQANAYKFFNRLDWNINQNNQLSIRDNLNSSYAINLERDQQDFRFSSIGYKQINNFNSLVAELKTRLNSVMNNDFIAGYTAVHDYREPSADPAFPQVQIVGETPGTTIFFGTDREASVFNQRQKTIEITDNFTWRLKKHTVTFGTHNEIYHIDYGFVNSWNGRVDYLSIGDFFANNISRVRGNYNYIENLRQDLFDRPSSAFTIGFYSLFAQDEIQITDHFKVIPGLRFDYSALFQHQALNPGIQNSRLDPNYGTTYLYPLANTLTNQYLGRLQASPRLGFRYDITDDQQFILRGGMGLFTGRIPLAWLGYIFYNTGLSFGSYDQKQQPGANVFLPGTDPLNRSYNGIAGFIQANNTIPGYVSNKELGQTQVDLVANNFTLPKVFRTSLALDFKSIDSKSWLKGFYGTVELIFTKTIKDVLFQQINITDKPTYYIYDQGLKQPIFKGSTNSHFSNIYLLNNTSEGFRYSLTGQLGYRTNFGLDISGAYTYGESKDVSNGIRNSLESNWQLNQALNPNNPGLAYSNFDLRHRIIGSITYRKTWAERYISTLSIFLSAQSGSPFTYGFVNTSIQGIGQQVSLAYIPLRNEAYHFFNNLTTSSGQIISNFDQANQFNAYIDANPYLNSRRGGFTERNAGHTPWNTQVDLKFNQDITIGKVIKGTSAKHTLSISLDCINFTNLLNPSWGRVYFSPNTFNSTASIGLQPYSPFLENQGYPIYTFSNPGKPYSIDFFNSRYQFQLGLRYSF